MSMCLSRNKCGLSPNYFTSLLYPEIMSAFYAYVCTQLCLSVSLTSPPSSQKLSLINCGALMKTGNTLRVIEISSVTDSRVVLWWERPT
jgi:hypothetical protein